jgi:hypothetical protein
MSRCDAAEEQGRAKRPTRPRSSRPLAWFSACFNLLVRLAFEGSRRPGLRSALTALSLSESLACPKVLPRETINRTRAVVRNSADDALCL